MGSVDNINVMWNQLQASDSRRPRSKSPGACGHFCQESPSVVEDVDAGVSGASVHLVLSNKREAEFFKAMETRMNTLAEALQKQQNEFLKALRATPRESVTTTKTVKEVMTVYSSCGPERISGPGVGATPCSSPRGQAALQDGPPDQPLIISRDRDHEVDDTSARPPKPPESLAEEPSPPLEADENANLSSDPPMERQVSPGSDQKLTAPESHGGMISRSASVLLEPAKKHVVHSEHKKKELKALREKLGKNNKKKHIHSGDDAKESHFFADVLDSFAFTAGSTALICLNTIYIGVETDVSMRAALQVPQKPDPDWFVHVNRTFAVLFTIELLFRIAAQRLDFIKGGEARWNLFDSVLVGTAVVEEIFGGANFSFVRIIRMLRLVKVLRIIRVLRFLRELRMMLCCVFNSMVSLMWAMLLLALIMFLFSICCMQGATLYLTALNDEEMEAAQQPGADGQAALWSEFHTYYGSLGTTALTMLYSISGGNSWGDAVRPLMEVSIFYSMLFSIYIVFVVFGVLNVLTGVFVDSAMSLKDRDLLIQGEMEKNSMFLQDMHELFNEMNEDETDDVSWDELKRYLNNEMVNAYFAANDLDVSDAESIFKLIDLDHSGTVTIEEFCLGCLRLKGPAKCLDVVHMLQESTDITRLVAADLESMQKDVNRLLLANGQEPTTKEKEKMDAAAGYMNRIGMAAAAASAQFTKESFRERMKSEGLSGDKLS
eukprot:gnl/TRDRNA2_/TRDRNA2_88893_c0_seq1.p1 gnl/TRDRNA2_/TRDRNA2_88893_c0~~gnl/TRDRNA2_/TRDRNA2_88893_c0_seq1.p1  ORF type:complete len:719 (+),score=148.61 gnl/TRDRNA2_/TRDRNA2_88893_c0_seq1:49-2205(+)